MNSLCALRPPRLKGVHIKLSRQSLDHGGFRSGFSPLLRSREGVAERSEVGGESGIKRDNLKCTH